MSNLEYEVDMIAEIAEEDGLLIAARGLGMEKLLIEMIKLYSEPSHLVIVVGTSADEENYVVGQLLEQKIPSSKLPRVINFDTGVAERSKIYANGGVLFVTSRILVVDLLVERIPIESITGIIVYNCHKVLESHQEKFILRLFRLKNKTGFVKGLTQTSTVFPRGFATVDKMMRSLFVKKLYLWPRFRSEVVDSFEQRSKADVIEIRFSLSKLMEEIQFAVLDLISMCLKEINKSSTVSTYFDSDEFTVENAIQPSFGRVMKKKFEPIWFQLPGPTKRLINDIKVLRHILFSLTEDDSVSFFNLVESVRQSVRLDSGVSDWIYWKPADTLFDGAKQRLQLCRPATAAENPEDVDARTFEANPKWNAFFDTVKEIKEETKNNGDVNVLVIAREEGAGKKLQEVLDNGPEKFLKTLFVRSKMALHEQFDDDDNVTEKIGGRRQQIQRVNLNDSKHSLSRMIDEFDALVEPKSEGLDIHYHHSAVDGHLKLEEYLKQKKPWFIIMYDADMESIRRLEVYQATHCSPERVKVYFFMFDASAEEQRYLTSLRREKDAFEFLVKEKASMVVPHERDGKGEYHPDLVRGEEIQDMTGTSSSRKGGITRNETINQKVIVDMREFRSELPSLLHKRGIDIEPVTIEIGDYVLTPDICVERKSISDLISSINCGRLYSQCSVMTRHYKRPMLLVEFDGDKPFNLKGKFMGFGLKGKPGGLECLDIMPKLILLTITFPKLRCIWSPSPHFSTQVFEHLKVDKEQPNVAKIEEISQQLLPVARNPDRYDLKAKEFLLTLPGVNLINVYKLMNKFTCIYNIVTASQQELSATMESDQSALALYESLHKKLTTVVANDMLKAENAAKSSKRFKRKK
ncbi:DNA repair endonuclease XPF [Halotydeus destructor]|nr:DNA repair endonuclease XPF [Halotydeus destructor]